MTSNKLLIETYYFSIWVNPDNTIYSGHSDGVGYVGDDTEENWIKVRDALNTHYNLTTFSLAEMTILKYYLESSLLHETNSKPGSMTEEDWTAFLDKLK